MKILNKDLSKKAKNVPKNVVKDKNRCNEVSDSDSDSEYFPSETDTSSDSDSDCESLYEEEKSPPKTKKNKTNVIKEMRDKGNDKMNNIIILSAYPNEANYDDEYDSDYVTTSDSGSENEEHEDVSVNTTSSSDSDEEDDEENEDDTEEDEKLAI